MRVRQRLAVVAALVAVALGTGAWTWPAPPSPKPKPPATTTTTVKKGTPKIEVQGPDPLVLTSSPTAPVVVNVTIKNVGPVDDSGGIGISATGSASLGISTGTCSRALHRAGTAGDSCAIRITVPAKAKAGSRLLTISGGPKAVSDALTVIVQAP